MIRLLAVLAATTPAHALTPQIAGSGGQADASQRAYLKASNTGEGDVFGSALDIDGNTLVVAAALESGAGTGVDSDQSSDAAPGAGSAYVFVESGGVWSQQAYLKASNAEHDDRFGISIAVSGDVVAVGAHNEDGGSAGVNGDESSNAVTRSGAVYVFRRTGSTWVQEAYLKASNPGDGDAFGFSVDVDDDTIVVGARSEDSGSNGVNGDETNDLAQGAGAAYVFTYDGTTWTQQAYLKASNTSALDQFGGSVAISGDTIVVGVVAEASDSVGVDGPRNDNSYRSGAAYVFVRQGTSWTEDAFLKASNAGAEDMFGTSVAISGDTIVVGADRESSAATGVDGSGADDSDHDAGAAYVFERDAGGWSQSAFLKGWNTPRRWDRFGGAVAVEGDAIVVGARDEDGGGAGVGVDPRASRLHGAGAAYVFERVGGSWTTGAYLKASNPDANDEFGVAVALDGRRAAVGSMRENGSGIGVNLADQNDDSLSLSGAAYLFELDDAPATRFCVGDDALTCPCANPGPRGGGCASSTGLGAWLSASGSNVVANDDLIVSVSIARPGQPGMLIQGESGTSLPFKDGVLCAGSPTERLEVLQLNADGIAVTTSSIVTAGDVAPGDTRYYQVWYRDPGGVSPCGTGSNLTNGLIVDWQ